MNETLLHDLQKYHHAAFERYNNFKKGSLYQLLLNNIKRGQAEQLYRAQIIPGTDSRLPGIHYRHQYETRRSTSSNCGRRQPSMTN